jgi:hypothetical protein
MKDHWLHGFNFNVEEWDAEGPALRDAGDLPQPRHRARVTVDTSGMAVEAAAEMLIAAVKAQKK